MVDDLRWKGVIKDNLTQLKESTVVGTDIVISLFQKNLINSEQREELSQDGTTNSKRAALLYTTIANTWIDSEFEEFKVILKETGNSRAFLLLNYPRPYPKIAKDCEEAQKEVELPNQLRTHNGVEAMVEEVKTQEIAEFFAKNSSLSEDVTSKEGKFIDELGVPISTIFPIIDECTRGTKSVEQLMYKVISTWYNRNGKAATTAKLFEVLKKIGCVALADDLEQLYGLEKRVRDQLSYKRT